MFPDSLFAHAAVLDVLGDLVVDRGGQRQVEEAVCFGAAGQRRDVSVEIAEGTLLVVLPADVRVPLEERRQPLRLGVRHLRQTAVSSSGLMKALEQCFSTGWL